jgi:hypothetical protein
MCFSAHIAEGAHLVNGKMRLNTGLIGPDMGVAAWLCLMRKIR